MIDLEKETEEFFVSMGAEMVNTSDKPECNYRYWRFAHDNNCSVSNTIAEQITKAMLIRETKARLNERIHGRARLSVAAEGSGIKSVIDFADNFQYLDASYDDICTNKLKELGQ